LADIVADLTLSYAQKILAEAENRLQAASRKFAPEQKTEFPNTTYFLPIIYGLLGIEVRQLKDMEQALKVCRQILQDTDHPLKPVSRPLDAGLAAVFAEEIIEALNYVERPGMFVPGEEVSSENIWLGAADDLVIRRRGVEFVDGRVSGFAVILGAAPDRATAQKIAEHFLEKNLYVFMVGERRGQHFACQLQEAGLQLGWGARLVSFGPDTNSVVFPLGFATRAAMSFGGIAPGDFARILKYNQERIPAFVLGLGAVSEDWAANAVAAANYGFPTILDSELPGLPEAYRSIVITNVPHEKIVARALSTRGIKIKVARVPVPVSYGPAFEGERVRGEEIYLEAGGGKSQAVELLLMKSMDEVEDGKIRVLGKDVDRLKAGARIPLALLVEVAGKKMEQDFEPILERQIHHLLNYAQGVMHIGQRDIAWVRISRQAVAKGFRLEHLGQILHAKFHQDFGSIVDKVQITIFTDEAQVDGLLEEARGIFKRRDERLEGLTDEQVDTYYSCTLCQSFAPDHVCIVTPERPGLCGAYNWLDCKASMEINPAGPNQPVKKGRVIDPVYGQWEGVNEFVKKASRGAVQAFDAYGILRTPMTSCGCFECIAALLPACQGFMTVDREFKEMTPVGMKFSTLAGMVGGGNINPGFVGHSKFYITSRKFLSAENGLLRLVWMPARLKEEIMDRLIKRAEQLGESGLLEKIADETRAQTEEEVLEFLRKVNHPVLSLPPIF